MDFDWDVLSEMERTVAGSVLGMLRPPDLIIAPDGHPYLYRWHLVRTPLASVYFHIQVADDPERPLHDHPWDNTSVILSGGYKEILHPCAGPPSAFRTLTLPRTRGAVIHRKAAWSHRLLMPASNARTMTLFSTGPKLRTWGFWYPDGWRDWHEVTCLSEDGKTSVHVKGEGLCGR